MIITPRSTENQSLPLESSPYHDQIAENLAESFFPMLDEYPTLSGDVQFPSGSDMSPDWDWSTFGDVLLNTSSQAEPWFGLSLSDPFQIQQSEDYSNTLNFDLQSDYLHETVERDFPIPDYMTSENGQALANASSALYQLPPSNSYSMSTESLQDMQSSVLLVNPDAYSDRIQFGDQQHTPLTAPSRQNHIVVEGDPIPSHAGLNLPKAKKLARRTKVTTTLGTQGSAPTRVEKLVHRGKKSRRSFDSDERAATACTRELGSCARCKLQKSRVSSTK